MLLARLRQAVRATEQALLDCLQVIPSVQLSRAETQAPPASNLALSVVYKTLLHFRMTVRLRGLTNYNANACSLHIGTSGMSSSGTYGSGSGLTGSSLPDRSVGGSGA